MSGTESVDVFQTGQRLLGSIAYATWSPMTWPLLMVASSRTMLQPNSRSGRSPPIHNEPPAPAVGRNRPWRPNKVLRDESGDDFGQRFFEAAVNARRVIEEPPGAGSLRIGELAAIDGLRVRRFAGVLVRLVLPRWLESHRRRPTARPCPAPAGDALGPRRRAVDTHSGDTQAVDRIRILVGGVVLFLHRHDAMGRVGSPRCQSAVLIALFIG